MTERPEEPITVSTRGEIPTPPKFKDVHRVQKLRNKTVVIRGRKIETWYDVDNSHLDLDEIEFYEYGNKEETRTIYKLDIPNDMLEEVQPPE